MDPGLRRGDGREADNDGARSVTGMTGRVSGERSAAMEFSLSGPTRVIPAKAGIHCADVSIGDGSGGPADTSMDPGFRRGDGRLVGSGCRHQRRPPNRLRLPIANKT